MNDNPLTIKFFLRNGAIVDWQVPDPSLFNFVGFCTAVRANGYFLGADVYIPHELIATIGLEGVKVTIPGRKPN